MQQEADLEEPDVIIPWPLVGAAALLVAFAVFEALLIGRGATPLDRLLMLPAPSPPTRISVDDATDVYIRAMLVSRLNRDLMGAAGTSMICGILLACAFAEKGASVRVLFGGFAGSAARRKSLLRQGEILVGVSVILWVVQLLSPFALRPADVFEQTVPAELAVAPVAFWGTLAHVSWFAGWSAFWRYVLAGFFACGAVFEMWFLLEHGSVRDHYNRFSSIRRGDFGRRQVAG